MISNRLGLYVDFVQWSKRSVFLKRMARIYGTILDGIYPHQCIHCDTFFIKSLKRDASGYTGTSFKRSHDMLFSLDACSQCLKNFSLITSPLCSVCGIPFMKRDGEDHTCSTCITSPPYYGRARSLAAYEKLLRLMIHRVKFKSDIFLAQRLGEWLFYYLMEAEAGFHFDYIIPIPLHIKRMRVRGFNQSHMFIKRWEKLYARFYLKAPPFKVLHSVVVRKRPTLPQAGLNRRRRLKNVKNAFEVTDPSIIKDKRILLVDDVWTTGATLNECARMLIQSGAHFVEVLTLARVI